MTREDLQQIAELMDVKLQPIANRLDKLEAGMEKLEARQDKLETMQEQLATEGRHTRVLLEKQEHNISLIAEQYGDIALKLERVREIDDLRDRVQTLETVARNHSARLRELDRAE